NPGAVAGSEFWPLRSGGGPAGATPTAATPAGGTPASASGNTPGDDQPAADQWPSRPDAPRFGGGPTPLPNTPADTAPGGRGYWPPDPPTPGGSISGGVAGSEFWPSRSPRGARATLFDGFRDDSSTSTGGHATSGHPASSHSAGSQPGPVTDDH